MVKFAIRNQGFWLFRYGSTSIPISSFYPSLPHSSYLIFISSLSVNHAIRTICPVTLCSMHLQRRLFNVFIINSLFCCCFNTRINAERKIGVSHIHLEVSVLLKDDIQTFCLLVIMSKYTVQITTSKITFRTYGNRSEKSCGRIPNKNHMTW